MFPSRDFKSLASAYSTTAAFVVYNGQIVRHDCRFLKRYSAPVAVQSSLLEAPPGFEPGDKGFADLGLTTWL